jgi:tRNA (cmo5U34)-methyltransferase
MASSVYQQSYQGRERAEHWDRRADLVIPHRQEVFDVVVTVLPYPPDAAIRVVDLGAGTGSLAERILDRWPGASVICVDNSAEMVDLGRARLAGYGERVTWLLADLGDPGWPASLPAAFHAVVSTYAVHLLADEAKRRLYRWGYEVLPPGGCLVNADRLQAASPELDALYHEQWMQFIVRNTQAVLGKDVPIEVVRERQRSMDESAGLRCVTLEQNLAWLRESGFPVVECFWKDRQRAVFGGYK